MVSAAKVWKSGQWVGGGADVINLEYLVIAGGGPGGYGGNTGGGGGGAGGYIESSGYFAAGSSFAITIGAG